ncbi:MAG: HigA family addiction module antitoxin [Acidobacteriota bacterium]
MNKQPVNRYVPDYLVTPGEVLDDYLESYGMTQAELADRTGLAKKTINEIIKAKSPITPETALKFERVLGRPAHFWNNLERQFQEDRIRLAEKTRLQSSLEWLKKIPVSRMVKWGWIEKKTQKVDQLEEVLRFFGIAAPDQWETVWKGCQVAYRQSQAFQAKPEAVSVWLRQGEIEGRQISCDPFDPKKFTAVLDEIRSLTTEKTEVFRPRLEELCASAGVAVVFIPEIPGTRIYGATRWIGNKAIIQLSLRYKSNDHLWFTFFHEAAHILKHGRKEVFIEGSGLGCDKEDEANTFACNKLIPPAELRQFIDEDQSDLDSIKNFAEKINIAPGIVVGRLQHERLIDYKSGNGLKVYYQWTNEVSN